MDKGPSRWGLRLLRRFCPPALVESVEGDLMEQYEQHLKHHSRRRANLMFLYHVFRFFRWGIISRNHPTMHFFNRSLMGNHIKIALRNYRRHFGYSLINLSGLAVGLAVCFILFSYTRQELSYDDFHRDIDKMYRINQTNIWSQDGGWFASTAPPLAEQMLQEIPGIEAATRINTPGSFEVRYHQDGLRALVFQENDVLAADSNFFDFFTLPLVAGDPENALSGKNKVVITEETAHKYFGDEEAMGKILLLGDNQTPVVVSGVAADLPINMHFKFNLLLSMPTNPAVKQFDWSWIWSQVATYVKVAPGASVPSINAQMTKLFNPRIRATLDRIGMDYDDFMQGKGDWKFQLQPVRSIHLHSTGIGNRLGTIGDIKIVRILQTLALLVLILALINFVNLSTARANLRSKEIGVKKSIGATTYNLAQQFQTESVLMTFMAGILAIPVILALTALIEQQIGIVISFAYFRLLAFLVVVLILAGIGFLAGIYPSIYLSSLKPISVLGGNKSNKSGSPGMRNVLVTLQFAISLALLSGSLLISRQLNYLSQKNLGFDRENILVVRNAEKLTTHLNAFRDELVNMQGIKGASVAMNVPGQIYYEDIFSREGSEIKLSVNQLKIDPYYFPTLGLQLLSGRNFEQSNPGDQNHVIISETAARLFGWSPEEALHQHIIYPELEDNPEVIGVSRDFNFQSLYEDIAPIIFFRTDAPVWGDGRVVAIKYRQDQERETIAQAHRLWDRFNPESPFNYVILNDELAGIYNREHQLSSLVSLLCLLSIFIAVLGLIGLVSFTLDQRRKEIGIRKVLGASLGSILYLINRQYLLLFLIGLAIAVPFTWTTVQQWLTDFAYHIPVTWTSFVLAGFILMAICLTLVGMLIYNTIRANPIKSIREE
ncbi:MAG: ABC transporter permease [Saprospiraceae bacterium]|nr:ABC transporter permease [Saprospiraceae bacterium]MCB9320147.1 ABC transporter permease [Lewinellaceae bacterium]